MKMTFSQSECEALIDDGHERRRLWKKGMNAMEGHFREWIHYDLVGRWMTAVISFQI